MKEFVIVTDTTTDLPREYVEKHHLYMMSLPYTLEGTSYTWENPMPVKEFYDKMRAGSLPTTSREFDTLKSKKVPQSLEIGLFFCQIFIFII